MTRMLCLTMSSLLLSSPIRLGGTIGNDPSNGGATDVIDQSRPPMANCQDPATRSASGLCYMSASAVAETERAVRSH